MRDFWHLMILTTAVIWDYKTLFGYLLLFGQVCNFGLCHFVKQFGYLCWIVLSLRISFCCLHLVVCLFLFWNLNLRSESYTLPQLRPFGSFFVNLASQWQYNSASDVLMDKIKWVYDCSSPFGRQAVVEIARLRQDTWSVYDYAIEFHILAASCQWNNHALFDGFWMNCLIQYSQ